MRSLMKKQGGFQIPDTSMLDDKAWGELNKLQRIHAPNGSKAFKKAVRNLREDDPPSYFRIIAALIPMKLHNMLKDWMAENGITEEDLEERVRQLHPAETKH